MASDFAPVIGGFLKGNIKKLCDAGVEEIAHYVVGRCQMTAKESTRPKSSNVFTDVKGELVCLALTAGLKNDKIKMLVDGVQAVIKHHNALGGGTM